MKTLDDLLRDTLTERAHDVETIDLTEWHERPQRTGHRRRWVAVSAVAVLAAAILAAVFIVAPWRDTNRHTAAAALPTAPPPGMQWVSYHGITLTIPDSWEIDRPVCGRPVPTGSALLISPDPSLQPMCPYYPHSSPPPSATIVSLGVLRGEDVTGSPVVVGGRQAWRLVLPATSSGPAALQIELPDVDVVMTIIAPDPQAEQQVLDGVMYTPTDGEQLPGVIIR